MACALAALPLVARPAAPQQRRPAASRGRVSVCVRAEHSLEKLSRRNAAAVLLGTALIPLSANAAGEKSLYDFTVTQFGEPVPLSKFAGKVTVVLNVASE